MVEGIKPNYFRFLTILSFHVFIQENVTSAIYEVGIGGEYDSTNILPAPTATGVTSLGIDHTAILGSTIEEIAWNKGGIYKASAKALTVPQPEAAMKVLEQKAKDKNTELVVLDPAKSPAKNLRLGLPGEFQLINATLAVGLAKQHLFKVGILEDEKFVNDEQAELPEEFIKGLENAFWPGRCQTLRITDNKAMEHVTWYLDGAHTKESIEQTGKWFGSVASEKCKNRVLLFNQQTRDANALVDVLHESLKSPDGSSFPNKFTHAIFCTNVTWSSGAYSAELTSLNTSKDDVDHLVVQKALAQEWEKLDGETRCHVFPSIEEAINFITGLEGDVQALVTGSLHLVGGVLAVFDGPDE